MAIFQLNLELQYTVLKRPLRSLQSGSQVLLLYFQPIQEARIVVVVALTEVEP